MWRPVARAASPAAKYPRSWPSRWAASPFEQIHFVGKYGAAIAEEGNQDSQRDGCFGHRNRHYEKREDLAIGVMIHARKDCKVDIYRVKDQLDGHQNHYDVAPQQHTQRSNYE